MLHDVSHGATGVLPVNNTCCLESSDWDIAERSCQLSLCRTYPFASVSVLLTLSGEAKLRNSATEHHGTRAKESDCKVVLWTELVT